MAEPASDVRTPGWPEGAVDRCVNWTAEMHRQFACGLLDANAVPNGEDGWNGEPAFRLYESTDRSIPDDPGDLAPFVAAIAHALLALSTPTAAGGEVQ